MLNTIKLKGVEVNELKASAPKYQGRENKRKGEGADEENTWLNNCPADLY